MASSMTGYGRGEAESADLAVLVELKSVNNRFRDAVLRLPREYLALEPRVLEAVKGAFQRGRIELYLRRTAALGVTAVRADAGLYRAYRSAVVELTGADDVPLAWVLAQPGVIQTGEADVDVLAEWPIVETALAAAIADLAAMRAAEGAQLVVDLRSCLDDLVRNLDVVEAVVETLPDRTREKLDARLRKLLGDRADPMRILQEAALLAEKADIREEIVRLRSHLIVAGEALDATEPVGRRLDFLLQEMGREINTIGSKSADAPVSEAVVAMKTALERMREQAANLE